MKIEKCENSKIGKKYFSPEIGLKSGVSEKYFLDEN